MPRHARALPLLALAALLALMDGRVADAQTVYTLDGAVSYVSFQGRARSLTVEGRSESLTGSISLPEGNTQAVRGEIRFSFASLEVAPRLFQHEFVAAFEAPPETEILFLVDSVVRGDGPNQWHMDGQLVIRGISHPVRFSGSAARIGTRIVAEGASNIDVRAWGIEPKTRMFGLVQPSPEVRLSFSVSFVPTPIVARAAGM